MDREVRFIGGGDDCGGPRDGELDASIKSSPIVSDNRGRKRVAKNIHD